MYLIHTEPFDSTNLPIIYVIYQDFYVAYNLVTGLITDEEGFSHRVQMERSSPPEPSLTPTAAATPRPAHHWHGAAPRAERGGAASL